jgi:hypothetical protein
LLGSTGSCSTFKMRGWAAMLLTVSATAAEMHNRFIVRSFPS